MTITTTNQVSAWLSGVLVTHGYHPRAREAYFQPIRVVGGPGHILCVLTDAEWAAILRMRA